MRSVAIVTMGFLSLACAVAIWASGLATSVAVIAVVLKFVGVSFFSGMSYWVPVQTASCLVVALFGTVLFGAITTALAD